MLHVSISLQNRLVLKRLTWEVVWRGLLIVTGTILCKSEWIWIFYLGLKYSKCTNLIYDFSDPALWLFGKSVVTRNQQTCLSQNSPSSVLWKKLHWTSKLTSGFSLLPSVPFRLALSTITVVFSNELNVVHPYNILFHIFTLFSGGQRSIPCWVVWRH